jgi:hypothetical protein
MLEPMLRSGPAGGPVAPASLVTGADLGRGLTLDTDVTSLLQRLIEDAKDKRIDMIPNAGTTSPVQIVRGNAAAAVQIGRTDDAAAAAAALAAMAAAASASAAPEVAAEAD